MCVGGERHALAALHPEKSLYPLYKRLGGPQYLRKSSPIPGFYPRTVQLVAICYNNWAIPDHIGSAYFYFIVACDNI